MAEIVNLRRARKSKARGEKEKEAAANRAKHGTPKHLHETTKASAKREAREHDRRKLDRGDVDETK